MIDLVGYKAVNPEELTTVQVDIQLQPIEVSAVGEYFVALATPNDLGMTDEQVVEQRRARSHVGKQKGSQLWVTSKMFSRFEQADSGIFQSVLDGSWKPAQVLLESF